MQTQPRKKTTTGDVETRLDVRGQLAAQKRPPRSQFLIKHKLNYISTLYTHTRPDGM